ncbi:protein APCDD1-like [Colossoma macropomum]|uniref:protein APCDD1-like n=1 Tax=Colossoma macropomum TaxID=42526 RepID=UPI001864D4B4|nr:protein APCDD1-like [Colossoma macropomum]
MFLWCYTATVLVLLSAGWCERLPPHLVSSSPVHLEKSFGRHSRLNQCHYMLRHLQDGDRISVHMPPDIAGHWVSDSCEVRSGPEFLIRSYHFYSNHTFQALQFYYRDNHCLEPSYTLLTQGTIHPRQASWVVRGGTEADFQLSRVLLVSHTPAAAEELQVKLEQSCGLMKRLDPGLSYELWADGSEHSSRDCTRGLDFSMQELQLLRMERRHRHGDPTTDAEELFLGDVHTEHAQRRLHKPSGYQPPLQSVKTYDASCVICQIVSEADLYNPPVLPSQNDRPLRLYGNWVSRRCEVRPGVLFLTRHFVFYEDSNIWEGHYYHFSDPVCRHPTFSISARGHYSQGVPSTVVMGGTELTFTVTHMKVTPMDMATTSILNVFSGDKCGKQGSWKLGVQQDVTPTLGCAALGIRLPHTEYELFRMGRDSAGHSLLFNGQRPTNGSSPDQPHKRATSYQPPLIHCISSQKGSTGIGKEGDHHFRLGNGYKTLDQHLVFIIVLVKLVFWSI